MADLFFFMATLLFYCATHHFLGDEVEGEWLDDVGCILVYLKLCRISVSVKDCLEKYRISRLFKRQCSCSCARKPQANTRTRYARVLWIYWIYPFPIANYTGIKCRKYLHCQQNRSLLTDFYLLQFEIQRIGLFTFCIDFGGHAM